MSNVFGVPPPPQPRVLQPTQPAPAAPVVDRPSVWIEPDRGRRRWALLAAFLAVTLLALANFAVWLQFTALRPAQATTVASATFDPVAERITKPVYDRTRGLVSTRTDNALLTPEPIGPADAAASDDVRAAVDAAISSATTRAAWEQAVATGLSSGRAALTDGGTDVSVSLPLQPIADDAVDRLKAQGYGFGRTSTTLGPYRTSLVDGSRDLTAAGGLASLWWVFLLGTLAVGALSIWLAARRLWLAIVLAIDTAVVFSLFLGLVLLSRQLADDRSTDPVEAAVVREAYRVVTQGLVVQTLVIVVVAACTAVGLSLLLRSRNQAEARRRGSAAAA